MKNRIREYIERRKMTQRELAEEVGVTEVTMSRYCDGKREPSISTAIKISNALRTSVYVLWEIEDD